MPIWRVLLSISALLPVSGCDFPFSDGCTDVGIPHLVVEVRDARTGAPAAQGASGTVQEGSYTDSLYATSELRMQPFDIERPGTYAINIQKAGYQDWSRFGVQVREGRCGHPHTRHIRADLQPES